MSKHLNDPVQHLKNLVSKKGKSYKDGVYYIGPSLTVDTSWDLSEYLTEYPESDLLAESFFNGEYLEALTDEEWVDDWNWVLVQTRKHTDGVDISSIVARDHLLEFISEDNDLTLKVTVPRMEVTSFPSEMVFYLGVLNRVASFSCKSPSNLRFSIGVASMDWDDVVVSGGARKMDVSF